VRRDVRRIIDVRGGTQLSADRPAQIIDQHEVILDASLVVARDAIEHLDDRTDLDVEPRLLAQLSHETLFQRLADLYCATGQAPLPRERLATTLDEQNLSVAHDHGADADEWTIGVLPVVHGSRFSLLSSCSRSVRAFR